MSESKAPEKIYVRWPSGINSTGLAFTKYQPNRTEYTRTDAIMSDPRVKALIEALESAAKQHRTIAGMGVMCASAVAYNAAREAEAALAAIKEAADD